MVSDLSGASAIGAPSIVVVFGTPVRVAVCVSAVTVEDTVSVSPLMLVIVKLPLLLAVPVTVMTLFGEVVAKNVFDVHEKPVTLMRLKVVGQGEGEPHGSMVSWKN